MMTAIRRGGPEDLPAVELIQSYAREAAHWRVQDYLGHDFRVVTVDGSVAGFLVLQFVAPDEGEVLNLAIAPEFRRHGLARKLLTSVLEHFRGSLFLEVRESNRAALNLYQSIGFKEVSRRKAYYDFPSEAAIVLKFHSC